MAQDKLKIWWDASVSSGTEEVSFEDLGIKDKAEWDALPNSERNDKLQEYLDNLPERVTIILNEYEVK